MILWALWGCRPAAEPPSSTPPPTGETAAPGPVCPVFGPGQPLGEAEPDTLTEASGLQVVEGVLWTHGDSGPAQLYALERTGARRAVVPVEGAVIVDWEDLATVGDRLVVGDIGDNLEARLGLRLVSVPIPDPDADGVPVTATLHDLFWPDGAHDAEALIADPVSGDLLVVAKEPDGITPVGRVAAPFPGEQVLEEVARLQFGVPPLDGNTLVTGGAGAPDGSGVALRTYLDAFVWPRQPGEPWAATFARAPCQVDLVTEPQGEAIAWAEDGLYTISEGRSPTIWFYPRQ